MMTTVEWLAPKIELLTLNLNAGRGRFCPHYLKQPDQSLLVSLRKPRDVACEECAVEVHYPPDHNVRCDRCGEVQPDLVEDTVYAFFELPRAAAPGAPTWCLLVTICMGCAYLDGFEE
jgi:hypothetical protein